MKRSLLFAAGGGETTKRREDAIARALFWGILGTGVVLPWAAGIGVKLYLQWKGRPTVPWSEIFNPSALPIEVMYALSWMSPFFFLAFIAREFLRGSIPVPGLNLWEKLFIALAAFGGGCYGAIGILVQIFLAFDEHVLLVPVASLYLPSIGRGLFVGLLGALLSWIVRISLGRRRS